MMTKKHYEKFAALFAGEVSMAKTFSDPTAKVAALEAVKSIILSTADIFAQDNPRFDREKFYAASGL
jgi:hypothetical protein